MVHNTFPRPRPLPLPRTGPFTGFLRNGDGTTACFLPSLPVPFGTSRHHVRSSTEPERSPPLPLTSSAIFDSQYCITTNILRDVAASPVPAVAAASKPTVAAAVSVSSRAGRQVCSQARPARQRDTKLVRRLGVDHPVRSLDRTHLPLVSAPKPLQTSRAGSDVRFESQSVSFTVKANQTSFACRCLTMACLPWVTGYSCRL